MTSFGVVLSQLQGLTQSQLSDTDGRVRFRLVRDVGTFSFEGQMYRGRENGAFTFTPDASFPQDLAKRGYERPSARQQFLLALHYSVIRWSTSFGAGDTIVRRWKTL